MNNGVSSLITAALSAPASATTTTFAATFTRLLVLGWCHDGGSLSGRLFLGTGFTPGVGIAFAALLAFATLLAFAAMACLVVVAVLRPKEHP
mgnify:CR=1 FL=1